jgi:hypothetical protein
VKITDHVFSKDGTFVRIETDETKAYYSSNGRFYKHCPVDCTAKFLPDDITENLKSVIDKSDLKLLKEYIKKHSK